MDYWLGKKMYWNLVFLSTVLGGITWETVWLFCSFFEVPLVQIIAMQWAKSSFTMLYFLKPPMEPFDTHVSKKMSEWCFLPKLYMYRVYLKCLDKLQEWVPHTKTRKQVYINIHVQMLSLQHITHVLTSIL